MNLSIATTQQEGASRIAVSGEVDVSNAAELRAELEKVAAAEPAAVAVDLSQVGYIDSTGIGVLVGAAHAAAEAGRSFAVEHPQANVKRVLGLLGVEKDLNVVE